jgi:hypothetical protein
MRNLHTRLTSTRRTLLALAIGLVASSADAQQLRSEERARELERKPITENVSSSAERAFEWIERYLTSTNRWYLTMGNLMPSSGLAPGVGYQGMLGESARFNVRGAWSIRNYTLGESTVAIPVAGDRLEIAGHARWLDGKEMPFYGLGDGSAKEARASYALRSIDVGATATLRPVPWLSFAGGASGVSFDDRTETTETRVSPDYLHVEGTAAIDYRESPGYTRRGGYYAVTVHRFGDRSNSQASFRQYEADVRQFIPVMNEHWVIGVRGYASTTDEDAGNVIPYFLMPTLGGSTTLRAYSDGRFRDRHAVLLSGEYRWVPGRMLDMAFFVDAGKVESRRQDLNLQNLRTSIGIGARFHAPAATVLRVEAAHGREGARFHFAFGKSF